MEKEEMAASPAASDNLMNEGGAPAETKEEAVSYRPEKLIPFSTTREEAIAMLSAALEKGHYISSAEALTRAALEREAILTTAMEGSALAFPHVRGVEGGGLTFAVGVCKEPIDWDGKNKVQVVVLSAIPVAVSAFYLRLLADMVSAFKKGDALEAMREAQTPAALWRVLVKQTRSFVK